MASIKTPFSNQLSSLSSIPEAISIINMSSVSIHEDGAESLSEFLKRYYNMGTKYLIIPGTFHKGLSSEKYLFKKSIWSFKALVFAIQGMSAVLPILCEFYTSQNSVWNVWDGSKFSGYYRIFLYLVWFFLLANLYLTFNRRGQEFSTILNKVRLIQRHLELAGVNMRCPRYVQYLPIILFVWIVVWSFYSNIFFLHQYLAKPSFETMLREKVCGISLTYCAIGTNSTGHFAGDQGLIKMFGLPPVYFLLLVLVFVGEIGAEISTHFQEFFAIIHAIVLYRIVNGFLTFLKKTPVFVNEKQAVDWDLRLTTLTIFEEICGLCELLDVTIGSIIAYLCFGILTYYVNMMQCISSAGWAVGVEIFLYATVVGSFLVLAAEANSMLGYFAYWFQNFRETNPTICSGFIMKDANGKWDVHERIGLALSQLQRNQIGIRGRTFTVTFGFVGNMLSLLLSYSILFAQLNSS